MSVYAVCNQYAVRNQDSNMFYVQLVSRWRISGFCSSCNSVKSFCRSQALTNVPSASLKNDYSVKTGRQGGDTGK